VTPRVRSDPSVLDFVSTKAWFETSPPAYQTSESSSSNTMVSRYRIPWYPLNRMHRLGRSQHFP